MEKVLTMETVGAFLKLNQDTEVFGYFRRHLRHLFPQLERLARTTFVRQSANLWRIKEQVWQHLCQRSEHDPQVSLGDSFPASVCRFARANRVRRLREPAPWPHSGAEAAAY